MKNVYVYCEGATEEGFIKKVLYNYFLDNKIYLRPIVCETKRTPLQKYKGGVSDYRKTREELIRLCKQHKHENITTMLDYYGLPNNTPGKDAKLSDVIEKAKHIESAIEQDINMPNLIVNLTIHEFEGLLFSDVSAFENIVDNNIIAELHHIRQSYSSPEHINDSTVTAPSKRIMGIIPKYKKVRYGTIIAKKIGIEKMTQECLHFKAWIDKLVSLA